MVRCTGVSNPPANGIMIAEGVSAIHAVQCLTSTFLAGITGFDPVCRSLTAADVPVLTYANLPPSGVTAGSYSCVSATVNTQGIITSISTGSCGGGGSSPIFQHALTESGGAATMQVTSASTSAFDDDTIALNASLTLTTPTSAQMAAGERILIHATTSGASYPVAFAPGAGVALVDSSPGGNNSLVGSGCSTPTTGWVDYFFRWDGATLELLNCTTQPSTSGSSPSIIVADWRPKR